MYYKIVVKANNGLKGGTLCACVYFCNYYDTSRKSEPDTKGDSNKGTADVHCIFIILINFI